MNIKELLPKYRRYLEHEKRFARSTVNCYLSDLRDLGGRISSDVDQIRGDDLRSYLRVLSERELNSLTIERKFAAISTFWRWLRRDGYTTGDPVAAVDLPRRGQRLPVWLSAEELWVFATTKTDNRRNALAWKLLAWLGLRRGELLSLRIEDVNVTGGILIIRKPKNKRDRTLPIPPSLRNEIQAVIAGRTIGWLLAGKRGGKWSTDKFTRAFHQHLKLCGLAGKGITPHAIRHSVGTHMAEQGVGLPEVQKLLGHVDIKSTMLYVHTSTASLRAALSHHILNEVQQ